MAALTSMDKRRNPGCGGDTDRQHQVLEHYYQRRFDRAMECFERVIAVVPENRSARSFSSPYVRYRTDDTPVRALFFMSR